MDASVSLTLPLDFSHRKATATVMLAAGSEQRVAQRKRACKPGSVPPEGMDGHLSGTAVTDGLEQPTQGSSETGRLSPSIWPCSWRGLPCDRRRRRPGELLPHPFTLTARRSGRRFAFCGTFRGIAPPGRYPAPCPAEPGLSSTRTPRPSGSLPKTIIGSPVLDWQGRPLGSSRPGARARSSSLRNPSAAPSLRRRGA